MNVGQIKTSIANKLQRDVGDFTLNKLDELLVAMNNAKVFAEQTHDFEKSRKLVELTISSPQGADLDSALLWNTATPVSVKSIINVSLAADDGALIPIDFRRRESVMAELRKTQRVGSDYFLGRYPPDWGDTISECGIREVMQYGNTVLMRPMLSSGSLKLVMECYTWFPEYNHIATYEDYFTKHGHNYLVWQGIVEANHISKEFVFRQEGNLQPPEKLAERYLQALITHDLFDVSQVDLTAD